MLKGNKEMTKIQLETSKMVLNGYNLAYRATNNEYYKKRIAKIKKDYSFLDEIKVFILEACKLYNRCC